MLKHEDWPGLEKISTLRDWQHKGEMREISILCGNGGLFLDLEVERGANGAMTGYCFPDMLVDLVQLSAAGQREKAHNLFDAHLPLMRRGLRGYLPMQNLEKISPSKSSGVNSPVI
ncbi:MAG: hypothetical protein Q7U05_07655 [Polaromonas sp.]|nr:hypothetical protein [Polaromonas sp.]